MPHARAEPSTIAEYRPLHRGQVAANPSVYVGDWDEAAEHSLYRYNRYCRWGGGVPLERAEELPREIYLVGPPEGVASGVRALFERTGCDRLFFWVALRVSRSRRPTARWSASPTRSFRDSGGSKSRLQGQRRIRARASRAGTG